MSEVPILSGRRLTTDFFSRELRKCFRSYDAQEKPQTAYSDLYRNHLNVRKEMTDRWTKNNIDAKYPRIIDPFGNKLYLDQYNPTSSSVTLGSFLEDVSYLRIRDISLSYNLPKRWLTHVGVSSLGFSFMMSNFFTFTNYSGIDPETPGTIIRSRVR